MANVSEPLDGAADRGVHTWRARLAGTFAGFRGSSSEARAKRGAVFGIAARVINAGLLFLTQILFARLLGASEFGIFALATTWIITLSAMASIGLTMVPQRFQPLYVGAGDANRLWGLYRFAHWAPLLGGLAVALLAFGVLQTLSSTIDPHVRIAILLGLLALPALAVMDVVEGFALANEWNDLAYGLTFIARPLLLPLVTLVALFGGAGPMALTAVVAFVIAAWIATVTLIVLVYRRFRRAHPPVAARIEPRRWFQIAVPTFFADLAYLAMGSADVLILSAFATNAETGIYAAAAKLVGVVAFVHFGLSYASAHHYAALNDPTDRRKLRAFAISTARWTFWPSLTVAVVVSTSGGFLLSLFGPDFVAGAIVMPILLTGLVARAFIGPSEQLLVMTDNPRAVTRIYAVAALVNAALGFALAPLLGGVGVALATAIATVGAAIAVALAVRRVLGGFAHALARPDPDLDPETIVRG
jgi:O-antigen/teichoic acid export membrane protein